MKLKELTEAMDHHKEITDRNVKVSIKGHIEGIAEDLRKFRLMILNSGLDDALNIIAEIEKAEAILGKIDQKL